MQEIIWPEDMEALLLSEQEFAQAHANLSDLHKALLKQCIAQIFSWYGQERPDNYELNKVWPQGFRSRQFFRPWPWVLVLVQDKLQAFAPLLAVVVPALLSRPQEVFVLRSSQDAVWPELQLCGLELAGAELVGCADQDLQLKIVRDLEQNNGPGLILTLEHEGAGLDLSLDPGLQSRSLQLSLPCQAGLWTETAQEWDLQTLELALPDCELHAYSDQEQPGLSPAIQLHISTARDFLQQGYKLLLTPEHMQGRALAQGELVLCPGQEASWIWSELQGTVFYRPSLALSKA